jgi:hypothetical protein
MKVVNTKQLAAAIGRTPRRVSQLYRSGVIGGLVDLDGRRAYNAWSLWDSVRDFADYKTRSRPGRPSIGKRDEAEAQSIFDFV